MRLTSVCTYHCPRLKCTVLSAGRIIRSHGEKLLGAQTEPSAYERKFDAKLILSIKLVEFRPCIDGADELPFDKGGLL